MGDRTKLPKWAQSEIERLERDKLRWFEKYRDINQDPANATSVYISDSMTRRPVQDFFRYGFYMAPPGDDPEDHDRPTVQLSAEPQDGYVEVYMPSRGVLQVEPRSSNVVWIRRRDW
jgi:hypothetical protein